MTSANAVNRRQPPARAAQADADARQDRSTTGFRQLLHEIGMLLCYEVTRDLPLEMIEIETPLATTMKAPIIAGKKLVFAPILRAGIGFLDGMLDLVPSARVAHIGLYRDPETLAGGRILLQGAARHRRAPGHRDRPDAGDRQFGRARRSTAEGARRQEHPLRLPARRARRHRALAADASRRADLDRGDRRATSTTTATSCRASATPATACTARNDPGLRS